MIIEVCENCRGPGMLYTGDRCAVCGGTGYPPGYTPPTQEQVRAWLREQEVSHELSRLR